MVTLHSPSLRSGAITFELLAAMTLLAMAILPLGYAVTTEKQLARYHYQRAVAMEILDGEMEVLAAGEWRAFNPGTTEYEVRAGALTQLPPGRFLLILETNRMRLEWRPDEIRRGGVIAREVRIP